MADGQDHSQASGADSDPVHPAEAHALHANLLLWIGLILFLALSLVVAVPPIYRLYHIPPAVLQRQVTQDFNTLTGGIEDYANDNGQLPSSIEQIPTYSNVKDNLAQDRFTYKKLTAYTFELCSGTGYVVCSTLLSAAMQNKRWALDKTRTDRCQQPDQSSSFVEGEVVQVNMQLDAIATDELITSGGGAGNFVPYLTPWCDMPKVYDVNGNAMQLSDLKPGQHVSLHKDGAYVAAVSLTTSLVSAPPAPSKVRPLIGDQAGITAAVAAYCKTGLGAREIPYSSADPATVSAKCNASDDNNLFAHLKNTGAGWRVDYLGPLPLPAAVTGLPGSP